MTDPTHLAAEPAAGREAWELLVRLFPGFRSNLMAVWGELDLTPAQGRILQYLDPERPVPMAELASMHACEASNITALVDKLEARGLIARQGDPKDRRVKMIAVTPAGATVRARMLQRIAQPPPFIATLSAADQEALRDVLRRATAGLPGAGCCEKGKTG